MTDDIAAVLLAIPLTMLFGFLAIFIVSESRRLHDHPAVRRRMQGVARGAGEPAGPAGEH